MGKLDDVPEGEELQPTGEKTGEIHVTRAGRHYAKVSVAAAVLEVSSEVVRRRLDKAGVKTLPRRSGVLVSIEDLAVDPLIHARAHAEIKVDANGYHIDEEGVWCTVDAFFENLDDEIKSQTTKQAVLIQAQRHCRSKEAVDRFGRPGANIYLYDELFSKGLALLRIGKIINPNTRHCVDEVGEKWGSKRFWIDYFNVTNHALEKGVKLIYGSWDKVPSEPGRNTVLRKGKVNLQKRIPVFSETTIRRILSYILDAEIKVIDGVYKIIDETGKSARAVYHSATKLSSEIPLDRDYIHAKLMRESCPFLDGVDRHSGADVRVFGVNRAREIFSVQIAIVTTTDIDGEYNDDHYGRCMTIERYCEENEHIKRDALEKLIEEHRPVRLRRRDARNNLIVFLYPKDYLDRISKAS